MFSFVDWAELAGCASGVFVVLLCAWHPASITINMLVIRWIWFDFMLVMISCKTMFGFLYGYGFYGIYCNSATIKAAHL